MTNRAPEIRWHNEQSLAEAVELLLDDIVEGVDHRAVVNRLSSGDLLDLYLDPDLLERFARSHSRLPMSPHDALPTLTSPQAQLTAAARELVEEEIERYLSETPRLPETLRDLAPKVGEMCSHAEELLAEGAITEWVVEAIAIRREGAG